MKRGDLVLFGDDLEPVLLVDKSIDLDDETIWWRIFQPGFFEDKTCDYWVSEWTLKPLT